MKTIIIPGLIVTRRGSRTIGDVRVALQSLDRAVSAQEMYRLLYDRGQKIGLASVYRALEVLVSAGEAETIRRVSEDAYVLCPPNHHHHAICRDCGRVDLTGACPHPPERSESGFSIEAHRAVYYGRCPDCEAGSVDGN